jgi:protease II
LHYVEKREQIKQDKYKWLREHQWARRKIKIENY